MEAVDNTIFAIACPQCRATLKVRLSDLGQQKACPGCHQPIQLPSRDEALRTRKVQRARQEFSFRCKLCGTLLYAHPSQRGESLACPDCHTNNEVPVERMPPSTKATTSGDDANLRFQDEVPASEGTSTAAGKPVEIRLHCPVCDCLMYASGSQVGKLVPCPDCGTAVTVRPALSTKRTTVRPVDPGIEIAPTFERVAEVQSMERHLEAGRAYADRIMAARPKPPKRPFRDGIYSFPFYLNIVPRWLGLSAIGCALLPFAQMVAEAQGAIELVVMIPIVIILVAVGLLMSFFITSMWNAILQRTAAGYDVIDEWPAHDIFSRVLNWLFPFGALAFSAGPFLLVSGLPHARIPGLVLALVSLILVFPIVFLSMAESNSPAMPYSRAVWRSVGRLRREWMTFHLVATPAWVLLLAAAAVLVRWPGVISQGVLLVVFLWFSLVYFRLLGRMAWILEQRLPGEWFEEELPGEDAQ